jgi:hypothetical protein
MITFLITWTKILIAAWTEAMALRGEMSRKHRLSGE